MKPFNLIISGTGGQGVFGLSQFVYALCERKSLHCQGSTFKGGAQRRGSIHSVLRIFKNKEENHQLYSTQLGKGEMDLLLSMEIWEALRYQHFMNSKTKVYLNDEVLPFYADRYSAQSNINPREALVSLGLDVHSQNFTELSKEKFGHSKMAGYLLLKNVIENKDLPFSIEELEEVFQNKTKK